MAQYELLKEEVPKESMKEDESELSSRHTPEVSDAMLNDEEDEPEVWVSNETTNVVNGKQVLDQPEPPEKEVRFEHYEDESNGEAMLYGVEDRPPIPLAAVFGLQQVLLSINACVGLPVILSKLICAGDLSVVRAELVSTFLVTCGISTFLQTTIGLRLPILQGGNYLILPAIAGILSVDHLRCPDLDSLQGNGTMDGNDTVLDPMSNMTSLNGTEVDRTEIWQIRMREVQGAIIMSSLAQFLLGASGALNVMLRFIGPITVTTVIMLIGLSLFQYGTELMQKQWGIGFFTTILLVIFTIFLRDVKTPLISWSRRRGFHVTWVPMFKLFPIVLSVVISWGVCGILTASGAFPDDPTQPSFNARTDAAIDGIRQAKWFFAPYPGQWGLPTVSFTGFLVMMAITIASMIESVGDYYACARVCQLSAPPVHAINRGLAVEGLVCIIGGLYGSGAAMTSYSNNIGAIAITKVGSRLCFQIGGLIFVLCGVIGKFGATLAAIPEPVLGGLIFVSLAFIVGSGMSNLNRVDLNSSRNQSVLGFSITLGLAIPTWLRMGNTFNTGHKQADLIINAFLSNAIFIGGVLAALLDNLAPGTLAERGMECWMSSEDLAENDNYVYDLPLIMPWVRRVKFFSYLPFMPTYNSKLWQCPQKCRKKKKANGIPMVGPHVGYQLANSADLYRIRRASIK